MSLWTPSGEHEVVREGSAPGEPGPSERPATGDDVPRAPGGPGDAPGPAEMEELRRQLAAAPAEVVVANHCYGLFELAAVYLSQTPPKLDGGRLAIDALGCLVEGLGDRLGESAAALREALAQIRLAYVQLEAAGADPPNTGPTAANGASGGTPA